MGFESFDIIKYLDDKNIPYSTSGKNVSAQWIGIRCPFCADSSDHLGIHLEGKGFSCFRCGEKGNAVKLVAEIEQCSNNKAFSIIKIYEDPTVVVTEHRAIVHADSVTMPAGVSKRFSDQHLKYIESRRFDPEYLIRKYDLYAGNTIGDFRYRIVAPVYLDHRLITLVGRDITDKSDRRYKALAVSKSVSTVKSALYNIDSVKDVVVLVEGIFDCWRIGDACVATFGTKVTHEQILLLKGIRRAFVLFDSEAVTEAQKLASLVSSIVPFVEIVSLSEGDPAELTLADVKCLKKELKI